jgi:hypothetical protein
MRRSICPTHVGPVKRTVLARTFAICLIARVRHTSVLLALAILSPAIATAGAADRAALAGSPPAAWSPLRALAPAHGLRIGHRGRVPRSS